MARIYRIATVLLLIQLSNSHAQNKQLYPSGSVSDFSEAPGIKWTFKTGGPIFSSPVVDESVVYIGSLDSLLYAIDISTGEEIWKFHTNGQIRSNVYTDGNQLYLNGGDGSLYSLNKRNGEIIWKFNTRGERKYDFADYFHSTPILVNGTLFFGSGDGIFYAVNSETGRLVWSFETGNVVHSTPAVNKNKIFFGSFDGHVYALSLTDGSLIWKFKTVGHRFFPAGEVQGSPSVSGNLVFIGARDYNVYALDQEKGYCHWNKAFSNGWGLNENIHDSILIIGTSDERILMATEPETGKEIWKKNMEFLVFGNNAYSNGMLYVGTTNGRLHGISLKSGMTVWSFATETFLNNRHKYFKPDGSYRDDIYSIIKSNEQFLEVECELGGIFSTPFAAENIIIFSSTNGNLYCLRK